MVWPLLIAGAIGGAVAWGSAQADDAAERWGITQNPGGFQRNTPLDTLNVALGWAAIIGLAYLGYSLYKKL